MKKLIFYSLAVAFLFSGTALVPSTQAAGLTASCDPIEVTSNQGGGVISVRPVIHITGGSGIYNYAFYEDSSDFTSVIGFSLQGVSSVRTFSEKIYIRDTSSPVKTGQVVCSITIKPYVAPVIPTGEVPATGNPVVGAPGDVNGYAWSSNIGWIKFNGTNYQVTMNSTTGVLSGYAWSSNIGWISFKGADVADCNSNSNSNKGSQAKIDLATGYVSGWIRALSGKGRTDGWDGCIELSGNKHVSAAGGKGGVFFDKATGQFSGYAWGDDVVGWVDFKLVSAVLPAPVVELKVTTSCTMPNKVTGADGKEYDVTSSAGVYSIDVPATVSAPATFSLAMKAEASGGKPQYSYSFDNGVSYSNTVAGAYTKNYEINTNTARANPVEITVKAKDSSSPAVEGGASCGKVKVTILTNVPRFSATCTVPSKVEIQDGQTKVSITPTVTLVNDTPPVQYAKYTGGTAIISKTATVPVFELGESTSPQDIKINVGSDDNWIYEIYCGSVTVSKKVTVPGELSASCPSLTTVSLLPGETTVKVTPVIKPGGGTEPYYYASLDDKKTYLPVVPTFTLGEGTITKLINIKDSSDPVKNIQVSCPITVSPAKIVDKSIKMWWDNRADNQDIAAVKILLGETVKAKWATAFTYSKCDVIFDGVKIKTYWNPASNKSSSDATNNYYIYPLTVAQLHEGIHKFKLSCYYNDELDKTQTVDALTNVKINGVYSNELKVTVGTVTSGEI